GSRLAAEYLAHPVHMATDDVSAEARAGGEGLFQIEAPARLPLANGGQGQGLLRYIRPEALAGQLGGREADAVAGDGVAQLHVGQVQLAGVDFQAQVALAGFNLVDATDGFDDSGKHSGLWINPRGDTPVLPHRAALVDFQTELRRHSVQRNLEPGPRAAAEQLGRHVNDELVDPDALQTPPGRGRA